LKTLFLNSNNLKEVPSSIGQLTQLVRLSFSRNQIQEIPNSIGNLANLRILYLFPNPQLILCRRENANLDGHGAYMHDYQQALVFSVQWSRLNHRNFPQPLRSCITAMFLSSQSKQNGSHSKLRQTPRDIMLWIFSYLYADQLIPRSFASAK
jgi:hypothetical protein